MPEVTKELSIKVPEEYKDYTLELRAPRKGEPYIGTDGGVRKTAAECLARRIVLVPPKPKKKTIWINLDANEYADVYDSKGAADLDRDEDSSCVCQIRVDYTDDGSSVDSKITWRRGPGEE